MNDIALFYLLKEKILVKYREYYPYHAGTIHSFGNKDIAQLIDLIEKECNERVSEKWVYTHLKPMENEKLPRKDMLDIFCKWTGNGNWDAFVFRHKEDTIPAQAPEKPVKRTRNNKIIFMAMGIAAVILGAGIVFTASGGDVTICLRDRYTQKEVEEGKVTLYVLDKGKKEKLTRKEGCFVLKEHDVEKLVVAESPYYKADTLKIAAGTAQYEFDLQPDDYAMMMRAYMNNNADDWKKRRSQLDAIISDDAVIVEVMFDDIGVEFLNKEEFINKMTTPSKISKAMEIVEIEYSGKKIVSLKYMQKEK